MCVSVCVCVCVWRWGVKLGGGGGRRVAVTDHVLGWLDGDTEAFNHQSVFWAEDVLHAVQRCGGCCDQEGSHENRE